MIVRRLKTFLSHIASRIAIWVHGAIAWAFGRGRTMFGRGDAETVGGAPFQPAERDTSRAAPNWLEDARRLRGRPAPRPIVPRPATETLRQILRDPHWTSAFEAGRLGRPLSPSRPLEQRPTLPAQGTTQPGSHLPVAPSSPTPETVEDDPAAETRRRLHLIREL